MSSFKTILLISKILSYDSNKDALVQILKNDAINWESLVKRGSSHLILPALYNRLKKKELLNYIPSELKTFLLEISTINYNRNVSILDQAKRIGAILSSHNINHVFLKGTALLALDNNDMLLERMVGDIDILVAKEDLSTAFNLIKQESYTPVKLTFGDTYFEHKHLPRLIPKKDIAAIEVHRKLLVNKNHELLDANDVLAEKATASGINIPSTNHLLKHAVYNHQLNDKGFFYNTFSLRSIYDVLVLLQTQKVNININEDKYLQNFFNYAVTLFNDLKYPTSIRSRIKQKWFLIKHKQPFLFKISYNFKKLIYLLTLIISRSKLFIVNANYRKDLIKDRKRVLTILHKKT